MSEPAGAQRRKIVLRPARPADVRAIYELVRPYADRRILIAKDLIAYFEDVQEFTVAEEVSADVWLGCWRSARAFRGDSQVLTWLLGIAKRQIWTHARRRRIPTAPLDEEIENLADDADDPAGLVAAAVSVDELVAALRSLPEDLAEVVDLAWLHELPYAQIASTLGIPAGTVKSRVSRARRILKDALRKDALRSDDA